jgi:hypothetical protein
MCCSATLGPIQIKLVPSVRTAGLYPRFERAIYNWNELPVLKGVT